ncbi:MAG: stage III sporulation protein AE [Clostridia bacterium]
MWDELFNTILKEAGNQLGASAGILAIIVSVAYLSSIFTATADLESSGNNDIISFAVICLLSVPVINNIREVVVQAGDTIAEIRTIMLSSIPGLCAMDIGTGAAGAAVFITITQIVGILLSKVFLPIAVVYAAVGICGSVAERFSLEGVKGMVRFLFTWGLGIMMIGFSSAGALSGALTGARTSMAGRTLKYTGAMVPVVGRYLAESADMVFAGASVLKGTAGVAAVAAILTAAAVPCIRMVTYVLVYRLAGILIRPVADEKISKMIATVGDAFTMITGVTILMSVMCVLNIAVLVTLVKGGG